MLTKQGKTNVTVGFEGGKNWQTSDVLPCYTGSLPTTDAARDLGFPLCTDTRLLQKSREDAVSCSESFYMDVPRQF